MSVWCKWWIELPAHPQSSHLSPLPSSSSLPLFSSRPPLWLAWKAATMKRALRLLPRPPPLPPLALLDQPTWTQTSKTRAPRVPSPPSPASSQPQVRFRGSGSNGRALTYLRFAQPAHPLPPSLPPLLQLPSSPNLPPNPAGPDALTPERFHTAWTSQMMKDGMVGALLVLAYPDRIAR